MLTLDKSRPFFEYRADLTYEKAVRYQGFLNEEGYQGMLAFCCQPTITLGLGSKREEEILVSEGTLQQNETTVLVTDRGGKCTYHGPGQLVGFPLINLRQTYRDARAVRRFTDDLLMGIAHACAGLGVKSVETKMGYPGVWTSNGKLASIGITVKNGFVFHGFSLNVTNECLSGFSQIRPCGMNDCTVTTLEAEGVQVTDMEALAKNLAPYLSNLFRLEEKGGTPSALDFDDTYDRAVAEVSRSPMALDYFCDALASSTE